MQTPRDIAIDIVKTPDEYKLEVLKSVLKSQRSELNSLWQVRSSFAVESTML